MECLSDIILGVNGFGILSIIYGVAFLTCLVLCFALKPGHTRLTLRVCTVVLAVPPLLLVLFLGVYWSFIWPSEPPTLNDLQSRFAAMRADLETIVRMSNEDAHYTRVAPDFLDRDEANGQTGRYGEEDPKAGLAKSRWDAYRNIYKRNKIELGVHRDDVGDAFIMLGSTGLLNMGHATGYLFCTKIETSATTSTFRFPPCSLNQNEGSHTYVPGSGDVGYSFRRLDGPWFAYDEGPS